VAFCSATVWAEVVAAQRPITCPNRQLQPECYMPLNDQNLQVIAEHYLINTIKLSAVEIKLLKRKLSGIPEILKFNV
jgi:hypothetical protein